jgi:hypothetical protein
MATKAQLAKAAADLKKAQANLAKVKTATAKKPATPTSGVIPGFKPSVNMPTTATRPDEPGFVGPVAPKPAVRAANDYLGLGPLGGIGAGVVAGVNPVFPPAPVNPVVTPVPPAPVLPAATSASQLIKARLKALNFPESIIDGSINFVESAMDDGMEMANAIEMLYNNKEYTTKNGIKLASPFYAEFTSLKENYKGDPRFTPTPKELMEFSLGVKSLVSRYGRSSKFAERTALEQYVSNGVRITDLDQRFATAALKTIEADPNEVKTLVALGFINNAEDLADFYLDPKIGQEQFEINAKTAAFGKQAFKRAESGITFDAARIKQLASTTSGVADAEATAAQGFETIANTLQPLTKLEQIYGVGIDQKAIQTQLEEEQFRGTASELRKRRKEQEELAFQRRSGTLGATRGSGGSLGTRSTLGTI